MRYLLLILMLIPSIALCEGELHVNWPKDGERIDSWVTAISEDEKIIISCDKYYNDGSMSGRCKKFGKITRKPLKKE